MESEEPIRIAQIMTKWYGAGVEAVIMNYYRHVDRRKIQFDFICDEDSTNIPYEEIESLGGRVIIVPRYQKIFKYIKELKRIFKENGYKIVHANLNTMSVFPLYAAYKARVPVRISHSHTTSNKKEWKKNILKNILRLFSKTFATDYFACSELAGRYQFGNKSFDLGRITIINNAIDLNEYKFDKAIRTQKREELKINEDAFVIGHVGRFVKQKNHEFLIDLFSEINKKNNNSILLLVGQGPLEKKMKHKVSELGLERSVVFLGQRNDVNELYQAMDLFLFPSLYEGLGMVMIEAQCSGLPCVASTEVPIVAKINDNVDFVSLSESKQIWINAIGKYEINSRKCNIDKLINTGYSIEIEADKLEKKYYSLIGEVR